MAPLDRSIKIFIGRLGRVLFGEEPEPGYTVCASVNSNAEALGILDKVGWHDGDKHFVKIASLQPTKEELEQISVKMEAVYQTQRKETGEMLP